jgi:hypothetical protein
LQLWSNRQPQGFDYRQYGQSKRLLEDYEGLALVTLRRPNRKTTKVAKRAAKEKGATSASPGATASSADVFRRHKKDGAASGNE